MLISSGEGADCPYFKNVSITVLHGLMNAGFEKKVQLDLSFKCDNNLEDKEQINIVHTRAETQEDKDYIQLIKNIIFVKLVRRYSDEVCETL